MSTASAKRKGAETQRVVATYLAENGWPYATDVGAGRCGSDILNTPGLCIEVKARKNFDPAAWLRQAATGGPGVPLFVLRPYRVGVVNVDSWVVGFRLKDAVRLLRLAGYGDPFTEE